MHVVLLSVNVEVATQLSDCLVVTVLGRLLTLPEKKVDTLVDVIVPNNVAVADGWHAISCERLE